jgi:signal transduction histidine kinase
MLRSLRFRLPALFLAGVVAAGLVAAALAFQLLQGYVQNRARAEVRREVVGLTRLYAYQATHTNALLPVKTLEEATADRLFFIPPARGISPFVGANSLPQLSPGVLSLRRVRAGHTVQFEFTHGGKRYIGAARPLLLGKEKAFFGALVVAKRRDELTTRVVPLLARLGLALLGGVLVATILGLYLSRRLTRPVLELSALADEVARGRYDVAVPNVRGQDEVAHLATRFRDMAARLKESEERERTFLMTVSHELRTPLTAIRGHVEALREGLADDPELRTASLDVIAAEAQRLERLVGDVLDLAKLNAHRFTVMQEEVDMARVTEQAYAAFAEEARRRRIDYRRETTASPVLVSDGDRVLQIISNLLANAFRWTPDGGRIALGLEARNGSIRVGVEDTGPGIAPEERETIFRPFVTQDGGGGTGLGLAIARELAHALGGRIELQSEPGRGSRFELVLPSPR